MREMLGNCLLRHVEGSGYSRRIGRTLPHVAASNFQASRVSGASTSNRKAERGPQSCVHAAPGSFQGSLRVGGALSRFLGAGLASSGGLYSRDGRRGEETWPQGAPLG